MLDVDLESGLWIWMSQQVCRDSTRESTGEQLRYLLSCSASSGHPADQTQKSTDVIKDYMNVVCKHTQT